MCWTLPWHQRSDPDGDLLATGVGNLASGLPMIYESDRGSANIHAGARTCWANLFHALSPLRSGVAVPWLPRGRGQKRSQRRPTKTCVNPAGKIPSGRREEIHG